MKPVVFILPIVLFVLGCGGKTAPQKPEKAKPDSLSVDSIASAPVKEDPLPFQTEFIYFSGDVVSGTYLHLVIPGRSVAGRINSSLDSAISALTGQNVAALYLNPVDPDSEKIKMYGESLLLGEELEYFGGLVSFELRLKRFGQKKEDEYKTQVFDLSSGARVLASDLVNGGPGILNQLIRQKVSKMDAATRYECGLDPAWNEPENYVVTREGLVWHIDEKNYPDRQFCKDGITLLLTWKDLDGVLKKDSPIVAELLRAR